MARARYNLPPNIKLTKDPFSDIYEGIENGITYQLTFSQMNALKQYYHLRSYHGTPSIGEWYDQLDQYDKKDVKRLNVPGEQDDFYPDNQPEF